jgi:cytosine/adenosine deaminase-related metal-dependent hydrolase
MTRAVNYGDAWHPNVYPLEVFRELVAEFRKIPNGQDTPICVRIGMNMKSKNKDYKGPQGDRRLILTGDMTENRRTLSELAKMGVTYAVVAVSPEGRTTVEEQLDSLTNLRDEVIKRFQL